MFIRKRLHEADHVSIVPRRRISLVRMHIEVKTNGKRGQEIVLRDECMERCTSHEISTIWSQMEMNQDSVLVAGSIRNSQRQFQLDV